MKQLFSINATAKKYLAISLFFFFQSFLWAQEKKLEVDINVNKKGDDWYMQPWVWVVGGAVFILILVGLLRGRGKKD
jgi:hypothetical protein